MDSGDKVHLRPAICDKARRKQISKGIYNLREVQVISLIHNNNKTIPITNCKVHIICYDLVCDSNISIKIYNLYNRYIRFGCSVTGKGLLPDT